jgi:undecaprenyl-diphosphatase
VFCFLILRRCYRTAAYWVGTLLTGEALVQVFRLTIHLPRSAAEHPGVALLGFPSGHTASSVILFGFLAILITRKVRHAVRWSGFGLSLLVIFLIALSRLYLGVQWLSGVLGGLSLGWVWTALAGIVYLRARPDPIPRRALAVVATTVFCLAGTWHVALQHRPDRVRYAPQPVMNVTERHLWMGTGWEKLPVWRVDIGGEYEQPLTLQWAGFPAQLRQRLLFQGWQFPPPFSLKTFLAMLSPDTALPDLPVLPHLHNGRFEEIRLALPMGDARWVLRLWPADLRLRGSGEPIWVGTVETQAKRRLAGFVTVAKDFGDYRSPLAGLRSRLSAKQEIVEVYRPHSVNKDRFAKGLVWNGQVLLIAGRSSSATPP